MAVQANELSFLRAPYGSATLNFNDPAVGLAVMKYIVPVAHKDPLDRAAACLDILEATVQGNADGRENILRRLAGRTGGSREFSRKRKELAIKNIVNEGGTSAARARWSSWSVGAAEFARSFYPR